MHGVGALAQDLLVHACNAVGLCCSVSWLGRQKGLPFLEHEGLVGVGVAVCNPEPLGSEISHTVCGLGGLCPGESDGHAERGGVALVGGTLRWSAHAAQQRSYSSLALGNGMRSLASGGVTIRARIMR